MKVAIVGSRDYPSLWEVWLYVASLPAGTVVVSGGARGVDTQAEYAAKECGMGVEIYPAEWGKYGRSAGMMRNQTIVDAADRVVAFWDGKSSGTASTIALARRARKDVEIVR
jgi:predicted Rossmann fold nucleotide-binding protein DprA/Smf involved in DNA uptake